MPLLVLALAEILLRRKLLGSTCLDNGHRAVAVEENKLARVEWKQLNGGDSALRWLIYYCLSRCSKRDSPSCGCLV